MTSERLKNLAKTRLILSVIAVLLAGLMIVSGIMHFRPLNAEPSDENPTESTSETIVATVAETTDAPETEPSVAETTICTEATEETAESTTEATEEIAPLQPEKVSIGKKPPKDDEIADVDIPHRPSGDHNAADSEDNSTSDDDKSDSNSEIGSEVGGSTSDSDSVPSGDTTDNSTGSDSGSGADNSNTNSTDDSGSDSGNDSDNSSNSNTDDSSTSSDTDSDSDTVVDEPVVADAALSNISSSTILTETTEPSSAEPETAETTVPTETTAPAESSALSEASEPTQSPAESEKTDKDIWGILFWSSAALLSVDLMAILVISKQIQHEQERLMQIRNRQRNHQSASHGTNSTPVNPIEPTQLISTIPQVASIHQVGRRDYQQDSLGHSLVLSERGMLAVLADGMGGLANGEKVSQKIVLDALAIGSQLTQDQVNGCLWKMVEKINDNANRMLGSDGLYKSGSTLVAVLSYANHFQWISVGDSRIYLYRKGYANQLNQDHDQLQVLMADVLSGRLTTEEALRNPDGRKLTSFIGMGQLKHVDGSQRAIALEAGDRLILMSDGIYTIIGEDRLADILTRYPDINQAASVIERIIRDNNHPQQDNYTAIILGF